MQRKSYGSMECPVARSLDEVGEWWSILILRDVFHGLRRFDEFEESLGIAPNMLARRLKTLVDHGLLARRRYSEHPPRYEHVLTPKGRDFQPVLLALLAWGNRHLTDGAAPAVLAADRATGEIVEPVVVDGRTGKALGWGSVKLVPGPAAGPEVLHRIAMIEDRVARKAAARLVPKTQEAPP